MKKLYTPPPPARLLAAARRARARAYAPYSRFAVGAALLTRGGQVFVGANLENSSFGATCCAERNALGLALMAGALRSTSRASAPIIGVCVVAASATPTAPCGICRQVLSEFAAPDCPVWLVQARDRTGARAVSTTLGALLPYTFGRGHLGG